MTPDRESTRGVVVNVLDYEGGARDVMVIVTRYGHGDTSSIPGQD